MSLINCFKNPDNTPSPHTTHAATGLTITIGGQPVTAAHALHALVAMRGARMCEARMHAARTERERMTSDGRPAPDLSRVELTPHPHPPEHACSAHDEREDRTDLHQYRLATLQGRLDALQRPLNAIANEAGAVARQGVGSWSREQVETLVRVSDLEEEVTRLLEALRERF